MGNILNGATAQYNIYKAAASTYGTAAGELKDDSGNGNDGQFNNAVDTSVGKWGRQLSFNDSIELKATVSATGFDWTNATGIFLVNPTSFSSSPMDPLFAEGWDGVSNGGWRIEFRASGVLAMVVTATAANLSSTTNTGALTTGTWYVVAGRYDGTNVDLRINGAIPDYATYNSGSGTGNIDDPGDPANLGWHFDASVNNYLDALLAGAWLWNSAISDANLYEAYEEIATEILVDKQKLSTLIR